MKRNLLMLFCILALVTTCLASCNNKNHTHTFSSDWESDATNHWHAATCEHGENKDSLAAHVDANEDGACDVCAYDVKHIHTYESTWSFDDNNHWKNATCSHSDEKGELSLHSDEDLDGACDACGGHVHNVNAAGYCKIDSCGKKVKEIDENNIDELIAAVYDQKWMINGGNIDYNFVGLSNTDPMYNATRNELVDYLFGKNNYTYMKVDSSSTNDTNYAESTLESWNQLTGPESSFGVYSEDNGATYQLDISNVDKLDGYYIALSTLAGEYGVENTLFALYEVAVGDTATDLEVIPDADGNKVTFKYNYKTVFVNTTEIAVGDNPGSFVHNVNYFEVSVTITYTDDYALTGLYFECDAYTNDPGTSDAHGFLYKDVDIEYDPDTDTFIFVEYMQDENGNWYYVPTDKRTPDKYSITITQTVGDRTEENPQPKEKFIPESYDLYLNMDEQGVLSNKFNGELIEANVRDIINFYVGDCSPAGTSIHFVADLVTFKVYKDGVEVVSPEDYLNETAVAMFTFAGSQRSFFIVPKVDGAYRFEIYLMGEMTHEINFHVGVVDEEFIDLKDNEFAAKVTETYAWTNEVIFTAKESGTYYFNLPAGIGFVDADAFDAAEETPETDDSPNPYFDFQQLGNEGGGSFRLTLEAGQTVRFYVSGARRGTYVISYYTI